MSLEISIITHSARRHMRIRKAVAAASTTVFLAVVAVTNFGLNWVVMPWVR